MNTFGERIRELRKRKGLSQGVVCEKAGIKQSSLSAIEKGATRLDNLKAETLFGLAAALRESPVYLYEGKQDELLAKLASIYSALSPAGQDELIGSANRILSKEKPEGLPQAHSAFVERNSAVKRKRKRVTSGADERTQKSKAA